MWAALRSLEGPNVTGSVDADQTGRDEFQTKTRLPTRPSIPDTIDDLQLDAMTVATPHAFHFKPAKAAFEEGIHTFVEKRTAKVNNLCTEHDFMKAAITGFGGVGQMYANVFKRMDQVHLTSVCDLNESKLENSHGATPYTDHFEMVDKEDFDISIIGTPPSARSDLLRASLESGAAVCLEKPTAVDLSSFDELHDIAMEHSAPVSAVQNLLYTPVVNVAIQSADDGIIGDVVSVEVIWREHIDPDGDDMDQGAWVQDLPVGGISESLPHFVYLALGFVDGLENFTVQWQVLDSQHDMPDGLAILGTDSSGRLVKVHWSGQCPSRKRQIQVYGSEGEMTVDLDTQSVTVEREGGSDSIRPIKHSNIPNPIRNRWSRGHYQMIMDYVDSTVNGNPTPPVPLSQDRDVIRVFETAGRRWSDREWHKQTR